MVADDIASGRLVEVLSEWDALVSRILPLSSRTPPHGRELRAFVDLAQEIVLRKRAKAS